jgi:MYXO-CTERM domain-containing protein
MRHLTALLSLIALNTAFAGSAQAELLFHGDFETGDLSQWGYLLNEEGLSVVASPVVDGTHAGKVEITKDNLWSNGLNRVEVQYKPPAASLADGAEVFYGYSFNLPEALSADNHQILYWETAETYQQVMQVAIEGQKISFATQKPSFTRHWEAEGAATPGTWHRLAMRVKWSADAAKGEVDLWFDGEKVVDAAKAQTYLGNPAFVQHGILRQPTIDKVETMFMDDARCGTTLADVAGMAPSEGGAGGGPSAGGEANGGSGSVAGTAGTPPVGAAGSGGQASGGNVSAGSSSTAGGGNPGGAAGSANGGSATAGAAGLPPARESDSGCSVSVVGGSGGALAALAALFGYGLLRRRPRR